ncbi:hypothetical protein KAR29_05610 [Aminithiophilus ramosus]|uniref:Uncharacterized protein n=2 Tax=Synergistales TaxID=649776 RepID=A0A9Q7AI28_9BACT|nr:hypothetical protein [Aminithiophilus ramosus]QTX33349.1 hypothetical protein KAR29_05610 [Aminithiophilus ramosus]QVL36903.1 hypothetical protein KIH16_03750 [Synergistota bacterium]
MKIVTETTVDYEAYEKNIPLMAIIERELSGKRRTRPILKEDQKALVAVAAIRAKNLADQYETEVVLR